MGETRLERSRLPFSAYLDKKRDESDYIIENNGKTKFYNRFVRNLESHHETYDYDLDNFILSLEKSNDEEYALWLKVLKRICYDFVRNNIDVVNELTTDINGSINLLVCNEMYSRKKGIINRNFPITVNVATVRTKGKDIIFEIEEFINDIENNRNNTVELVKTQLDNFYGDLEEPYLINYYNQLLLTLDEDIIKHAKGQITRVNEILGKTVSSTLDGYARDMSYQKQKYKNNRTYVGSSI